MDLAFSEEQDELRTIVRRFLETKSSETDVRRLMATETGFDPAVWAQMGQQIGLQGLTIPEEFGGAGYSFMELTVVLEEMGRSLLCAPYFSTVVLAVSTLLLSENEAAQKAYLPAIAEGELRATLAVTEASGRWREGDIDTVADNNGTGWRLTGSKSYVLDGHTAELVIVAARAEEGVTLFAVEGDAAGMQRVPVATMDQTRKLATVHLDAVAAEPITEVGRGWLTVERVLNFAAAGLAAEQVGGAQRCLEMAVDYAQQRVQFGRVIGSFQAIKHKAADVLVDVESARSAAYYAGAAAAQGTEELPAVASLAKAYCSEAYLHAASENIQIHGGIGFTWEHPAHLYYKRAWSSAQLFGNAAENREQYLRRLGI